MNEEMSEHLDEKLFELMNCGVEEVCSSFLENVESHNPNDTEVITNSNSTFRENIRVAIEKLQRNSVSPQIKEKNHI